MRTLLPSDQDSNQPQSPTDTDNHFRTLWLGLLFGLLLVFLDRRAQAAALDPPKRQRSWRQHLLFYLCLGLALFLVVNLLMGP